MQGLVINEQSSLSSQNFVQSALNQKLLLVGAGPKVIRLVPPLVINEREIKLLLKRLEATCKRHE